MSRATLGLLVAALAGCLSSPSPADPDDAAPPGDARGAVDAAADAAIDAAPVGPGTAFPPPATSVRITGGWSGDLNGDLIDDLVLLSDTGASESAGVYVLLGQRDLGLPDYHQFLATGAKDPLAVTGVQLDGVGGLDLVLFAVDYGSPGTYDDNESYLHAYLADGAELTDPPLIRLVTESRQNHLFPRTEGEEVGIVTARLIAGAGVPGIAVFHGRGSFALALTTWGETQFQSSALRELQASYPGTGGAAFPSASAGVDDLIAFTDSMPQMTWLVNDGAGNFSGRIVEGVAPGVAHGALFEMTGAAPPDVLGAGNSCLQATPVDDSAATSGVLDCPGDIGYVVDILAFESDADGPEVLAVADVGCTGAGGRACLYMLTDAYIDGGTSALKGSPYYYALPTNFSPAFAARGDFDGDGELELTVVSTAGEQACVKVEAGAFVDCL